MASPQNGRALALALVCLVWPGAGWSGSPGDPAFNVQPSAAIRAFLPWSGTATALLEASATLEESGRAFITLTGGSYWQPWRHLRLGAFLRYEQGNAYETDWSSTADLWVYPSGRSDLQLLADATPRLEISEGWMLESRFRFQHGFTSARQTLKIRPGVTHLIPLDEERAATVFLHQELYLSLNYGTRVLSESWTYLGGTYPLTPVFEPGILLGYRSRSWATASWTVSQPSLLTGLFLNLRL